MEGRQRNKRRWERGKGRRQEEEREGEKDKGREGRGGKELSKLPTTSRCPMKSIRRCVCFFLGMGKQASYIIIYIKVGFVVRDHLFVLGYSAPK